METLFGGVDKFMNECFTTIYEAFSSWPIYFHKHFFVRQIK